MVQWLRVCAPSAGGPGSIPSRGTRLHMPQLGVYMLHVRVCTPPTKDPDGHNKDRRPRVPQLRPGAGK